MIIKINKINPLFIIPFLIGALITSFVLPGNKITRYEVQCIGEVKNNVCEGHFIQSTKATYKVDSKNQKIISNVDGIVSGYDNCDIFDRKNWQCDLENGESFGFQNGKHFDLPSEKLRSSSLDILAKLKQVSMLNYYLVWTGYDKLVGNYLPNSWLLKIYAE